MFRTSRPAALRPAALCFKVTALVVMAMDFRPSSLSSFKRPVIAKGHPEHAESEFNQIQLHVSD